VHDFRFPPEDDNDKLSAWPGYIAFWVIAVGLVAAIVALVWFAP